MFIFINQLIPIEYFKPKLSWKSADTNNMSKKQIFLVTRYTCSSAIFPYTANEVEVLAAFEDQPSAKDFKKEREEIEVKRGTGVYTFGVEPVEFYSTNEK